jgi:hypothetical protein
MGDLEIQRFSPADDPEAINVAIDRDGVVILSGLLDPAGAKRLRAEIDPQFAEAKFCEGPFYGTTTKRIHSLVAKSRTCRELLVDPALTSLMQHVLGPACDRFQLNFTQGIQIHPGEEAQILHRDDVMFPMPVKFNELMVNVIVAASDFTSANGATVVVPGSHLWEDRRRRASDAEITCAEMDPGDAVVFVGSLVHGGGANRTRDVRTGVTLSYCLGWLRQFENQYFVAPPEICRDFPKELQDLLGYAIHRPNLGMYEGCEPSILFDMPDIREIVTHDWLTPAQYQLINERKAEAALKGSHPGIQTR